MNKRVIAVVIAVLAGGTIVFFGENLGQYLFPPKSPMPTDITKIPEYIQNEVPFMAKFFVILSYAIASFVAGIFSSVITGRTSMKPMFASVGILMGLALFNFLYIPHPTWMWIGLLLAFFPMGMLAYYLIRKKPEHE